MISRIHGSRYGKAHHCPLEGYSGRYVWHYHSLEHVDNEMMRPFEVLPTTAASTAIHCPPHNLANLVAVE